MKLQRKMKEALAAADSIISRSGASEEDLEVFRSIILPHYEAMKSAGNLSAIVSPEGLRKIVKESGVNLPEVVFRIVAEDLGDLLRAIEVVNSANQRKKQLASTAVIDPEFLSALNEVISRDKEEKLKSLEKELNQKQARIEELEKTLAREP